MLRSCASPLAASPRDYATRGGLEKNYRRKCKLRLCQLIKNNYWMADGLLLFSSQSAKYFPRHKVLIIDVKFENRLKFFVEFFFLQLFNFSLARFLTGFSVRCKGTLECPRVVKRSWKDRRKKMKKKMAGLTIIWIFGSIASICNANPDAKRLYDDLLSNYNRLIRPVTNNTDTVVVKLGLRLSQLIDLVSKKKKKKRTPHQT